MALPVLLPSPAVSGEIFVTPSAGSVQPVSQGAAATITAPWPVELSDGAEQVGTSAHPLFTSDTATLTAPLAVELSDGTQEIGTLAHPVYTAPGTGVTAPVSAVQLPTSIGQKNTAGSLSVAMASDAIVIAAPDDGQKATYSAAILGLVPAASATDVFTITGSATKTVRITRLSLSGTQTTTGEVDVQVIKRSAANTGGTSTAPTAVAHDSASSAATASVKAYTANPSGLGAAVGPIRTRKAQIDAATAGTGNPESEWLFGNRPAQAVVLRGVAQVLAVNLNGVTVTGGSLDLSVEWTEE